MDTRLAGVDGLEKLKNLRQQAASIPFITLSAGLELAVAELVYQAGVQAYLLKPVRLQTKLDVVAAYQLVAKT